MYHINKKISPIILVPILYFLVTVLLLTVGYTNAPEGWSTGFPLWVFVHAALLMASIIGFVYNSRLIITLSAIYIPLSFLLNQLSFDNLNALSLIGLISVFLLLTKAAINSFNSKVQFAL